MTAIVEAGVAHECSPPPSGPRPTRPVRGYASGKGGYLARLRRIEGQVRGLQKMIEDDRWCPDIVTQVASATRALQEVAVGLLNDHLRHCVMGAANGAEVVADRGNSPLPITEIPQLPVTSVSRLQCRSVPGAHPLGVMGTGMVGQIGG